ncbi:MRP motif repeat 3 precursor, partial [Brachionus plicatilis]
MKSLIVLIACLTIAFSVPVKQQAEPKDLVDFALNSLGLGQVIDTIQALGTDY